MSETKDMSGPSRLEREPRVDEDYITIPKENYIQRIEQAKQKAAKAAVEEYAKKLDALEHQMQDYNNLFKRCEEENQTLRKKLASVESAAEAYRKSLTTWKAIARLMLTVLNEYDWAM